MNLEQLKKGCDLAVDIQWAKRLQSTREAYRTVLLTAVNRKHQQLRKEFEQL